MGRSLRNGYKKGESWQARHERRRLSAIEDQGKLAEACREWQASLTIKNHGEHWKIVRLKLGAWRVAEWWPSSAKLIIDQQWDKGIHCHDVFQVIEAIRRYGERTR